MPVTVSYPGVYVEEIPSGVRTITGVATSITAFIGRALRGPTDEPVTINSYGDFERIFGGLWAGSSLGYAVRDFYTNGGSQAIIVRLFHPKFGSTSDNIAATKAATLTAGAAAGATSLPNTVTDAKTERDKYTTEPQKSAAQAVYDAVVAAAAATGASVTTVGLAAAAAAADAAPTTKAKLVVDNLTLEAISEGSWGNNLRARVDYDVAGGATNLFNLSVRDGITGQVELFRNVSVEQAHLRRVDKVLENDSSLVRVSAMSYLARPAESSPLGTGETDIWAGGNNPETNASVVTTDDAGDGGYLGVNDFTGPGKDGAKQGLYALAKADLFNLLCIPPYLESGDVDPALVGTAGSYCELRRAMLLVDPPSGWNTKQRAKDGVATVGTSSKNAALFFPRLRQPDPARGGQVGDFAPCGAIAGVFARTDTTRGVWKAPAGLDATLVGVPELTVKLTDGENGELNPLGINCLRSMPAAGRIVWGSRTLQGDDRLASDWKYIPVRRLALFIEESLYRGTQWVVFEPNDEPLWAQIRLNLGAFMHNLFRQGAFQGTSPKDAYFIKCDKETTIQNDINLGIVNIVVGFAPLKPAEFVIIQLQQMAGQIQT
jgi:phage tail sheath protein FI